MAIYCLFGEDLTCNRENIWKNKEKNREFGQRTQCNVWIMVGNVIKIYKVPNMHHMCMTKLIHVREEGKNS